MMFLESFVLASRLGNLFVMIITTFFSKSGSAILNQLSASMRTCCGNTVLMVWRLNLYHVKHRNMKDLYSIMLAVLVYVPASAQTVTLRFDGSANSNNTTVRNYMADVDGRKYYSSNADVAGNAATRQTIISDLSLGSHKLQR